MSIDDIRSFRNAQPFRPFTLLLRDGRVLHVELPLRIAFAPDGRRLAVFDGPRLSMLTIDDVRLASVEDQSAASQS